MVRKSTNPCWKTLYFSARRADNKNGGISSGDRKFFSDIYVSQWDETKNEWGPGNNINDLVKRLNTNGFDAVSTFSTDGQYVYLSINTDGLDKPKPATKSADIYYSKISSKGNWGSPKPLQKKASMYLYHYIKYYFSIYFAFEVFILHLHFLT